MADQKGTQPKHITTDSRLRVWWLTRFRNFRVDMHSQEPRERFWGQIQYINRWRLVEKPDSSR